MESTCKMYPGLARKTILVTGAGDGIGRAICARLITEKAKVIAVSRSPQKLESLQKECPGVDIIKVDLKNWQETRDCLSSVPHLDGLVNNAGVAIIKPFADFTEQDFDDQFDVNVKAVFNVTQALLDRLKEECSVVMVSSLASNRSFAGHSIYSATKSAVDAFTRSLALELGPRKIRVNSVNPGLVLTAMGRENWSEPAKANALLSRIPLKRFCELDEVVDSVVHLLSSNSSFMNGSHVLLDGGYTAA